MGFTSFKFDPKIATGIREQGYTTPTPIQRDAIPHVLEGKDVLGLAQTGTGKTAAFALPILQRLSTGPKGRLRALVVAPTRELAEQIHESFKGLGKHTGIRSMTVYGGVGVGDQLRGLRQGVEIIVACPGRLLDHCQQGAAKLGTVEVVVLDEADRMFDMGFLPDIRKILGKLPAHRQTLLFSATMPPDISKLAHDILRHPVRVEVDIAVPLTTVSHALFPVPEHLKNSLVIQLLKRGTGGGSVLVFSRTKHRAKRLAKLLQAEGLAASSLHGNLSQNQRKAALAGFRDGTFDCLVATDIAARGLDISQITHVINYDIPDTTEAYTHRIGRTGRAARTGDAFTLVTPADESMVRSIERVMRTRLERRKLEGFIYTAQAPARQPQPQQQHQRTHHGSGQPGGHHRPGGGPAPHARHGSQQHSGQRRRRH